MDNTNQRVKTLDKVAVRFSGDSGDGMQLAGNIFTNVSAGLGNSVSTFPDYPAEIRAPQGSLGGVSGFQVSIGIGVHTPGDQCDVPVSYPSSWAHTPSPPPPISSTSWQNAKTSGSRLARWKTR